MPSTARVQKLSIIPLDGSMDVETAAKTVFAGCTAHLNMNFHRFRETGDAMALMQMRIGMRRMRVALQIFRAVIPKGVRSTFNRECRYFGDLLGEARNMDVFLNGVLRPDTEKPAFRKVSRELLRAGEATRAREYDLITHEIAGGHFERLAKSFDKWLASDWSDKLGRSGRALLREPIAPFALKVIEEGNIELLNRGADVGALSVGELHDLRKYVKRSRYHLRFFASLFREDKIAEGFALLIPMQDYLGLINDVKEGIVILGRLSASIRSDCFAETLRFNAHVYADASDHAAENYAAFLALWRRYETYTLGADDLLPRS